jgi:hypothetical protein
MKQPVGYRVVLDLLENCLVFLSVDGQVNEIYFRGEQDFGKTFFTGHKVDLFRSAIQYAWYLTGPAL